MPDRVSRRRPGRPAGAGHGRSAVRGAVLSAVVLVVLVAAAGALAGVVWEWAWSPPQGVVAHREFVPTDEAGLRAEFAGTGWYVVVAAAAGLLVGAGVALLADRRPLVALGSLVVGTALGAWLMRVVGVALGPDDPSAAARTAKAGAHVPDVLGVSGFSPYLAYPTGALVALAVLFLGLSAAHRSDRGSVGNPDRDG